MAFMIRKLSSILSRSRTRRKASTPYAVNAVKSRAGVSQPQVWKCFLSMLQVSASTVCACVDVKTKTVSNWYVGRSRRRSSKCDHKTELAVCKTLASKRKREKALAATRRVLCRAYQPRKHASAQRNKVTLGDGRGLVNRIVLRDCGKGLQNTRPVAKHRYQQSFSQKAVIAAAADTTAQ